MDRTPAIRRVILANVSPPMALAWSVAIVVIPTILRWAVDRGEAGMPFITYYPAVVLAALLLGWRWAAGVALACGIAANRVFAAEPLLFYASPSDAVLVGLFALSCAGLILIGETCRRLMREIEAAKGREEILNHELMHRVKNMLATVNAMATLTARHSSPEEFPALLSGRMRALLRATELLGGEEKGQCDLRRLVDNALAPFRSSRNFTAEGLSCELPRDACVPLSLALHELCTNAVKYGALSRPEGRVSLLWTVGEGADDLLRLAWREDGGPPVTPPSKTGMGMQLLRRQRGLSQVEVRFEPAGLCCDIEIEGVAAPAPSPEKAV